MKIKKTRAEIFVFYYSALCYSYFPLKGAGLENQQANNHHNNKNFFPDVPYIRLTLIKFTPVNISGKLHRLKFVLGK